MQSDPRFGQEHFLVVCGPEGDLSWVGAAAGPVGGPFAGVGVVDVPSVLGSVSEAWKGG